jgi:hypothetical protein
MSRRALTYAALVVTSFVVAACSQPTAPRRDDTITCNGRVIVVSMGRTCDDL